MGTPAINAEVSHSRRRPGPQALFYRRVLARRRSGKALMSGLRSTTWRFDLSYGRSEPMHSRTEKKSTMTISLQCAKLTRSLLSDTTKLNINMYTFPHISVQLHVREIVDDVMKEQKKRGGGFANDIFIIGN